MKASVRANFVAMSVPWEGQVNHFYADVKNLITIGIGSLVDPIETALVLPMYRLDGVRANRQEIRDDWNAVKRNPHAARLGHRFAAKLTTLRMRDEDVYALTLAKLDANDKILQSRFPDFESLPADAQLSLHSLAWACGPHFHFPKMQAALAQRDFLTAAVESKMNEKGNPGLIPRNRGNRLMLQNAHVVECSGLDPELLYWPHALKCEHLP